MIVNGVFEGGGVKAIALVGAVRAAEEQNVRFHQVAGTSSGAIVSSFLAAGYTANELKSIIMETPFTDFLAKSWLHEMRFVGPAIRLFVKKGLYSGQRLEQWVAEKLAAKGIRTFADLPRGKLRIIASDISQGKLLVLPDDIASYGIDPQRFPVARAVRMSTSIPYFFDPVVIRKAPKVRRKGESFSDQFIYIVDGGLLSNFPLWIYDQENSHIPEDEQLPTLGFHLVGKQSNAPRSIYGPLSMLQALFATMMEAHDERYIEEKYRFRTIKIPTLGVRVTDFDIKPEKSLELYESGYASAKAYFQKWSHQHYVSCFNQFIRNGGGGGNLLA
ncbi:patatin-like phospholipase family protein [Paenibacillus flagellatus]|uniref:Patatin n=1 Tax=Paenibacillus flagellatus TaxID=2211139 RepID=A0A2V5KAG3_9BACL|nr:patatin-like phospholipase family protein [Paenibacillus flagellatus]PYI55074.1 patatin [Paenibacillus flagellatus]